MIVVVVWLLKPAINVAALTGDWGQDTEQDYQIISLMPQKQGPSAVVWLDPCSRISFLLLGGVLIVWIWTKNCLYSWGLRDHRVRAERVSRQYSFMDTGLAHTMRSFLQVL